jgi:cytochrome c oxidase cbb3-type subunit III
MRLQKMRSRIAPITNSTVRSSALTLILLALGAHAQETQPKRPPSQAPAPATPSGQRTFASRCAGCHGLDGRGGERAANIASNPRVQRLSDPELQRLVSNGLPDFGMPAFRLIGSAEIKRVVEYMRTLQGGGEAASVPGDPQAGRALFFGKAGCSSCHRAREEGGFLGPDLSTYANGLPPKEILRAITNPEPRSAARTKIALAQTRAGQTLSGAIRNEDNFSVQLQSSDGVFHFLMKTDLASLEYQPQPAMPTDYGHRLSPGELDNLASYLHSLNAAENVTSPGEDQP